MIGVPEQSKHLALDVICLDVTKRMRSGGRKLTIAEAKNILGINPSQAREVRAQFYNILKRDNFVSKVEAGLDHWNELKQQWFNESQIVQQVLTAEDNNQSADEKHKAIEILCRDVMKRFRDDLNKADPSFKKQVNIGPGPGPVHGALGSKLGAPGVVESPNGISAPAPTATIQPSTPTSQPIPPLPYAAATAPAPTLTQPVAALFRLHPSSNIQASQQMFLTTISSGSLDEITNLANSRYGGVDGRTVVVRKIEGILANDAGVEAPFSIQNDAELVAYLGCVGDGRVVFSLLVESYLG